MCSGRRSATLPRQRGAVSARAQGLGQVWHARGTVQCAVEVDPLREERATGVLDGCLFTRRLRWHAVRAAAGLHKVGVHACGWRARAGSRVGQRSASRPGAAVPADAALGHSLLGGPRRSGNNSGLDILVGACPPVILSPALACNHPAFHDTS